LFSSRFGESCFLKDPSHIAHYTHPPKEPNQTKESKDDEARSDEDDIVLKRSDWEMMHKELQSHDARIERLEKLLSATGKTGGEKRDDNNASTKNVDLRDSSELPDVLPICKYGELCTRNNKDHTESKGKEVIFFYTSSSRIQSPYHRSYKKKKSGRGRRMNTLIYHTIAVIYLIK